MDIRNFFGKATGTKTKRKNPPPPPPSSSADRSSSTAATTPPSTSLPDRTNKRQKSSSLQRQGSSSQHFDQSRVFAKLPNGRWAIHDYRMLLQRNTIDDPLIDGGGNKVLLANKARTDGTQVLFCSNAPRTLFNEHQCKLSNDPNACTLYNDALNVLHLNETTLVEITQLTGRFVYAINGLIFDETNTPPNALTANLVDLPCQLNSRSRWVPTNDANEIDCSSYTSIDWNSQTLPSIHSDTANAFSAAIASHNNKNTHLRNVYFRGHCHANDTERFGFRIWVSEEQKCYENVHPDHLSVYDVTNWAGTTGMSNHPGGYEAIAKWNSTGILVFPASTISVHTMDRWQSNHDVESTFGKRLVGRYGDLIRYTDLPEELQRTTVGDFFHIQTSTFDKPNGGGVMVCGSPGEVEPDPEEDDHFAMLNGLLQPKWLSYKEQKETVWTMMALYGTDQLRQRVAWALWKNIPTDEVRTDSWNSDHNIAYYDIFVRNAFGNYKDVLREVAFSPKMGEQLTYVKSRSVRTNFDLNGILQFPDENFAREVMQLFTIGLSELNIDGTEKLNRNGKPIPTYDTKDILTFARAWTGFWYNLRRGNYADVEHAGHSRLDPLTILLSGRDWFPKRDLHGGWIGDYYPLCTDLPERAFLKIGARFRLLGGRSLPEWQSDRSEWEGDPKIRRFVLDADESALYDKLDCTDDGQGNCVYANDITLTENLPCHGDECKVSTVRVVQVKPGVFYEYLRRPCVQLAIYENAKKIFASWHQKLNMCGNPKMPIASESCCGVDTNPNKFNRCVRACLYYGERMTYATNEQRCSDLGGYQGDAEGLGNDVGGFFAQYADCHNTHTAASQARPHDSTWHWTNVGCSIQMKVSPSGLVALVHDPPKTRYQWPPNSDNPIWPEIPKYVSSDMSVSYFAVPWDKDSVTQEEIYPTVANSCGSGACSPTSDGMCLCNTTLDESPVFYGMNIPTREEILSQLRIGAFEPEVFGNEYTSLGTSPDGVEAYGRNNETNFNMDTIFKVTNEFRETVYMKNVQSDVQLGELYQIRNPANFMDYVDPELRDAYYETDAVLEHYLKHPNTGPFVSKLLIQSFGNSNPSPRYVEVVATAFQEGMYRSQNYTFGDGKRGNLGATVAAILLDREATSVSVEADPAYGSLKEPVLKVMQMMRSLEFTRTSHHKIIDPFFGNIKGKTGQFAYRAPDIFSFFQRDYQPSGQFSRSALYAPEAQTLTLSQTLGIVNGFLSLVRQGLNACDGGLGSNSPYAVGCRTYDGNKLLPAGNFEKSSGYLAYSRPSNSSHAQEVVDELATLLTSGRLSDQNRQIILDAYNSTKSLEGQEMAIRVAQQLLATSPEFHSTNPVRMTGEERTPTEQPQPSDDPYKAIVYIYCFGGMDSFYMLSPHSSCDLYDEYSSERSDVAALASNRMTEIDAGSDVEEHQPCEKFGVNDKLSAFSDLYKAGQGIFLANTGHLSKPVTKNNYRAETQTQLFSHNTMELEAYYVDAFKERSGTGVLGRMLDVIQAKNHAVGAYGIDWAGSILDGDPDVARSADVISNSGPSQFIYKDLSPGVTKTTMRDHVRSLNSKTSVNSGLFGNHWSQTMIDSWNKTDILRAATNGITLDGANFNGGGLISKLKMVAKLIKSREERKTNRDVFYMKIGGYDTHSTMKGSLDDYRFPDLNKGIQAFKDEMINQGVLDNITVIVASEFGRTITPNTGGGTDHAWGGNYFVFGGGMKGGRILGKYPEGFTGNDPTNDGRGRLIPTTSWEALWNGVANWFGIIEDKGLNIVLPNRNNFGCRLFSDRDLYVGGVNNVTGCSGGTETFYQEIRMSEPRYLTGEEQKTVCFVLTGYATEVTNNSTTRCIIVDQVIRRAGAGGRRRATDNEGYILGATAEISSDEVGFGEPLAVLLSNSTDELAEAYSQDLPNVTGVSETISITNAPTVIPSEAPSSAPSATPETSTTTTTTTTTAASLGNTGWSLEKAGNATVAFSDEGSDEEVVMPYRISSGRTANVTVYNFDCESPLDPQNVITLKQNVSASTVSGYDDLRVALDFDLENMVNSSIMEALSPQFSTIQFCVRVDLIHDLGGSNGMQSITFHKAPVSLTMDMQQGFSSIAITQEDTITQIQEEANLGNVTACLCDSNLQCLEYPLPKITQSSGKLQICVKPDALDVEVNEIRSMNFIQIRSGNPFSFPVVAGGQMNPLTEIDYDLGVEAFVQTRLISSFFDNEETNNVTMRGVAILSFAEAASGRRQLEEYELLGNLEGLDSEFDLVFEISNEDEQEILSGNDASAATSYAPSASLFLYTSLLFMAGAVLATA